jgi:hypothetical protein
MQNAASSNAVHANKDTILTPGAAEMLNPLSGAPLPPVPLYTLSVERLIERTIRGGRGVVEFADVSFSSVCE